MEPGLKWSIKKYTKEDSYSEIAQTVVNGRILETIYRISQSGCFGELVVSMKKKNEEGRVIFEYYYRRKFAGLPGELEKIIDGIKRVKALEMAEIAIEG